MPGIRGRIDRIYFLIWLLIPSIPLLVEGQMVPLNCEFGFTLIRTQGVAPNGQEGLTRVIPGPSPQGNSVVLSTQRMHWPGSFKSDIPNDQNQYISSTWISQSKNKTCQ